MKLWDSYLHEITFFVTGVLITFGRFRLDWIGGRSAPTDLLETGKSRTTAFELVEKIRYYFA